VAPDAQPPVCRIMDFGKYKYTQSRRLKESRAKKQTTIQVKEVKMGAEDREARLRVQAEARAPVPRGKAQGQGHRPLQGARDGAHGARWKMLQKMVEAVTDIAVVESNPRMEGRMLHLIMSPKQAQH